MFRSQLAHGGEQFSYDVFLSYSSKDKAVVRAIAERLRADGLQVWFDEWELRIGDVIPARIEEGLEHSRVLVLCMSANGFGSDWAQLESGTFRFRDPLNKERRFIPVRFDDAPARGSLGQFVFVDWRAAVREREYPKLLAACMQPRIEPPSKERRPPGGLKEKILSLGHTDFIRCVAFSPDGANALTASADATVRVWDLESGRCLEVLEGHASSVWSVVWSPDGSRALSGSDDHVLRLWDVKSGHCLREYQGHSDSVRSVAWSPGGGRALSGSDDNSLRVWEVKSGRCLRVLEGHSSIIHSVAWSPKVDRALSGSADNTLRLWEVESGRCLRVLEGHSNNVLSVAFGTDGSRALSGSEDQTVRLWDVESGRCLRVLEGHSARVLSVAFGTDGSRALSGSADNTVRLWDVESGHCLQVLQANSGPVLGVALNLDGGRALSGSADNKARVWDIESGRCLQLLDAHSSAVWTVAWSHDGSRALSSSSDDKLRLWDMNSWGLSGVLEGHSTGVWTVAWSPDGVHALSGSEDETLRLWNVESGRCLRVFEGHAGRVRSVSWSPDGRHALSGGSDQTVRLWDMESNRCSHVLTGHSASILSVAWSPDGTRAISGSEDRTVRVWDVESGACSRVLEGHSAGVRSVAWSRTGHALSGSDDRTLGVWDVVSGRCLRVLEGHSARVLNVAGSPDGKYVLSGSADKTVRVWNISSGRCVRVLEGHSAAVRSVDWSLDGRLVFSGAVNGVMRVWDLTDLLEQTRENGDNGEPQIQYTNAKVLLVGDSGAGKTGLSMRLALQDWKASDSTVGAWATHWKLPVSSEDGIEREIWLWDFGGQADQRLIHQLYMDDTSLAVLVFDGQRDNLFETLGQWERDLTRASRRPFAKLLVAGRVDAGGLRVSRTQVEAFAKERGFTCCLETSAKANLGCEELKAAILAGIRWADIPWRSSPVLFKRLKEEIVRFKDDGRVLMRFNELRDALRLRLSGEHVQFQDEELKAVVGLLAGPGVVWELTFGNWVLLQPERINAYAQAVIQTVRGDEFERGAIAEERVLGGDLVYHSSMERLPAEEERFVLLAMHQTLVERALCLREHTENGPLLIFPSYYRRERPELVGHPAVLVSYRFHGFLDDIYSTLVVRLHHTKPFQQDQLWRYAADFKTLTGKQLGVKMTRRAEGAGELEVYFDPAIPVGEKIIFSRYVHEHLTQKGQEVVRLRYYVCPHCGTPVGNREVAMKKLEEGKRDIICAECEKRVPLWDDMEELFASDVIRRRVRDLQEQSDQMLKSENAERSLVGGVISTVALAGQICRELNVSDHSIDMEIEFNDDNGRASGRLLYLLVKSGKSFVDGRKPDEDDARYWMGRAFPVMLVIRTSDGEIRWIDVREWLNSTVFERFDVMSVRRWRQRLL